MSRHLLAILLTELQTVRVLCRKANCGAVFETPLAELARRRLVRCPICGADWDHQGGPGPLAQLAEAMAEMARYDAQVVGVEFVMEEEG